MLVANATGCSSIYGGSLPTTPWTHNAAGRGPAWSNSLFEDNAEFGLGFRVAIDKQAEYAQELLRKLTNEGVNSPIPTDLATAILTATQTDEADIVEQRQRVAAAPLSEDLDNIKRLEDAGAAAIVLHSLFEEQIEQEMLDFHHHSRYGTDSFAEALTYAPEPDIFHVGPDLYLEHIRRAKEMTQTIASRPIWQLLGASTRE
jgi:pyruvate/2-oxoacid:ferredoxin oxidoreductase beta subunit